MMIIIMMMINANNIWWQNDMTMRPSTWWLNGEKREDSGDQ